MIQPEANTTPAKLLFRLQKFTDVGKVVYGRRTSIKPLNAKYVEVTVLQFIASNMIKLSVVELEDTPKSTVVSLNLLNDSITPIYLTSEAWKDWSLIN